MIDVRGGATAEEVASAVGDLVTDAGASASVLIEVDGGDVVVAPDLAREDGLAALLSTHDPSILPRGSRARTARRRAARPGRGLRLRA